MASHFEFDQAEGLRRMLSGPRPRVFTFLSAAAADEKASMLVNLAASLSQAGSDVVLFDARIGSQGISMQLDAMKSATLLQVARRERSSDEAVQAMPQGFGVATLARGAQWAGAGEPAQQRQLADSFDVLARRTDIMLVDAELDNDDRLPLAALLSGEVVVQVSAGAESIKNAYAIIKRISGQLGRRPFSVLVTGASEKEAQVVFQNMAQAANRSLAVKLNSMGSVPADDHVKRAARAGRAVVDAFPLAGASVAFRRLAGRFALPEVSSVQLHGISAGGAN